MGEWGEGGEEDPILGPCVGTVRCQLTTYLGRACKPAGLPIFTGKGYRRLMSRRLMQSGTDHKVYEEIMGHSYAIGLHWYRTEGGSQDRRAALEHAGAGELPAGEVVVGPWEQAG